MRILCELYMAEQQNTRVLFEPRTVSMIIRGAFGTPLTQHHRRQYYLQHASQAYQWSFKINACAQLRIIINNARRFYSQDIGKPRYTGFPRSIRPSAKMQAGNLIHLRSNITVSR